ncbi:MAG: GNAT family N-acetyltransferase [Acidobacteriota bacterium]
MREKRRQLRENLEATLRTFAAVRGSGEVWEEEGLMCVYSGLPGAVFNTVMLTEEVREERELAVKLEYVEAMYRARRARWSLWLLEYLLAPGVGEKVGRAMERYGGRKVSVGWGMHAAGIVKPRRKLPELEVVRVERPAQRYDFCQVMGMAFRTPLGTFLDVYHSECYWRVGLRGYVAYAGGMAVGTACVMGAAGVVGVSGVAVLPEMQRIGIGERVVRYAIGEGQRETGNEECVLEASEMAAGLYRRLGFEAVTGVSVYNAGG